MVRAEYELPSHQIRAVLPCELYNRKKLPSCDTVTSLWFSESSTSIGDHPFVSLLINLGQDCPNADVTGIGVQDEFSRKVWECQNGCRAQAMAEFLKCYLAVVGPYKG
jgi:hypothetical protein